MSSLGLDFGTTNTVVARGSANRAVAAQAFRYRDGDISVFRSVLSFWQAAARDVRIEGGAWAIDQFIEFPEETRFLQSFKTYAASAAFEHTWIFGKKFRFEDILDTFFQSLRIHADSALAELPERLVIGRPVKFAGLHADPALAQRRYEDTFRQAGFREVCPVLEPVAAAFFYAQRLQKSATILVGDFGGGTSDFSIVRFEKSAAGLRVHPLSQSGVGIAGDTFDYRIIDAVISPKLGKDALYESWGKLLSIPSTYHASFAKWNELCLLNSPAVLKELRTYAAKSKSAAELNDFIEVLESNVAYPLYRAVSKVKEQLSVAPSANLAFRAGPFEVDAHVTRAEFETWIADDLRRLDACVADALSGAGVDASMIDKVFLTGGTSFVPAVQNLFVERFGAKKVETGDQLLSIALGLALIGQEADIEPWLAQA